MTEFRLLAVILFVICVLIAPGFLWIATNYKRKRLCLAFLIRLTRYEFWPTSLFYLPIVIYYLCLCIPCRRIDLLTPANPGMPDPFHTPKTKILSPLAKHPKFGKVVAGSMHLPRNEHSEWHHRLAIFQKKFNAYPLVIKPESGERGKDVHMIHNAAELQNFQAGPRPERDYLVQEYISGPEYGIHYIRLPGRKKGQIDSLIRKEKIVLLGDGRNTLERLILQHPRAFIMAKIHFAFHSDQLHSVPRKNQQIQLVTIGAHSRGTVFRAAPELITPQLEEHIDNISKALPGFYVGRYDLIASGDEDIKQARNLKIIELNGVMGEPGHLYHPNTPLPRAYGILAKYCRSVVAIAKDNIRQGYKPADGRSFFATICSALYS